MSLLFRIFFGFFTITAVLQLLTIVLSHFYINNLFLLPIYLLVQILGLGFFYSTLLNNLKWRKYTYLIIALLLISLVIELSTSIYSSEFPLTWYTHIILNIVFAIISFSFLLNQMDSSKKTALLIINISIFFYLSIHSLIFFFGDLLLNISSDNQTIIWNINTLAHLVFITLIGFSLWKIVK